ncbi:hypothetical protein G647_00827 [Cladophialophora carrionii CBS 160.54]|uniref:Isochorismatase-like domain-containing protein n=1 Tax=Cladophialophora carrionii CBS 160.54 TaxID=1279043 RepID=V9DQ08_9EURO|nr:uncharacterized protein G647_00827 [Cladophialophora carrionii CBS 160.54]ETI28378.1 hypothetical protein G647_00827 [Cladophialophora carrionii CBS 160.54]
MQSSIISRTRFCLRLPISCTKPTGRVSSVSTPGFARNQHTGKPVADHTLPTREIPLPGAVTEGQARKSTTKTQAALLFADFASDTTPAPHTPQSPRPRPLSVVDGDLIRKTPSNVEAEFDPEAESEADFDGRSLIRRHVVRSKADPFIRKTSGPRKEIGVLFREGSLKTRGSKNGLDSMSVNSKRIANPVLFICDVQEKFRGAIWEFDKVIKTSQKMVKAAKILNFPIFVTTQNAARLGDTVEEVASLLPEGSASAIDKTAFSMLVPDLQTQLEKLAAGNEKLSVFLVGIETHICVTQTTLDLLSGGHKVYVLADGVSSCNAAERPVALNRLAREGAIVTTSESLLFELVGDAKDGNFRAVSGLVKETKEDTKVAVETFCRL